MSKVKFASSIHPSHYLAPCILQLCHLPAQSKPLIATCSRLARWLGKSAATTKHIGHDVAQALTRCSTQPFPAGPNPFPTLP